MSMDELSAKLDMLLATNDYPVFSGYRDFLKERAMEHAEIEWHRFMEAVRTGLHLPPAPALQLSAQAG